MTMANIALLFDTEAVERRLRYGVNVFQRYLEEVLAHAGIPYTTVSSAAEIQSYDIVIAGVTKDDEATAEALWDFAVSGGALISYRGLNKLARKLHCVREQVSGAGYARIGGIDAPIRYLESEVWKPGGKEGVSVLGSLHDGKPNGPHTGFALLSFKVGGGSIHRWAVDIPATIVAIQQGISPVLDDGIPAKDGTGDIDESILKADDRIALDWELDRAETETGMKYFEHPHADYWREALIGHLIKTGVEHNLAIPFVDEYPEGVERVAMLSFDSDLNVDAAAMTTLDVLGEFGVPATWCIIAPGFSKPVYDRAKREGIELAMHYNALEKEQGIWSRDEFQRQNAWVKEVTGIADIVTNKNHYTRFEGWGELFRWCESAGIQTDETRGPSKKGNIGFTFGTCRPYFPIAWFDENNRFYDVLEVGFLTQDLNHPSLADDSVAVPFLEQVRKVRGVAHFLFHQYHVHNVPKVRDALRKVIREAKQRGFEFWTNRQVNDWERSRRALRIQDVSANGKVKVNAERLVRDAIVWVPCTETLANAGGHIEDRYGVPCVKQVIPAAVPMTKL